ncbi:hypothetical protein GGP97_002832 [Salinibacter ruber]|nr:hypothetical protein [Salinibacter ruber]
MNVSWATSWAASADDVIDRTYRKTGSYIASKSAA